MAEKSAAQGRIAPSRARVRSGVVAGLALAALVALVVSAPAAEDAEFYKGKQIRLIVGSTPGGGYDTYARTIAAHLPKHLPGMPKIVVQNMPGAGSLVLSNYLYNIAPRDGTVIAAVHSLSATHPLFFPDRAKYDPRQMNWLGSALRETHVGVVWHTAPVQSFAEVFKRELIVSGSGGSTNSFPAFCNAVLDTRFNIVKGYDGTKQGMLAMERGEVSGVVGITYASLKATSGAWLNDGKIKVLVQFGLTKHPELPDAPWVFDFAKTNDDRAAMNLMFATQEFGRPYVAPPGLPENVVQMLRSGFEATLNDPEFQADATKRKLDLDYTSGPEIHALLDKIYEASPAVVGRIKDIIGDQAPQ
jgi:tripartite-type tricarboxylate transporter receptor subunit TctC